MEMRGQEHGPGTKQIERTMMLTSALQVTITVLAFCPTVIS